MVRRRRLGRHALRARCGAVLHQVPVQGARQPWPLALGPWPLALGPWPLALGPWPLAPVAARLEAAAFISMAAYTDAARRCKAGTAVMYDNRIFHNALPNTSGADRCALICSYQPYGRSQSGQVVANAQRLLEAGRLGEDRKVLRQLLGWRLGLLDGYDQPGFHLARPSPDNR